MDKVFFEIFIFVQKGLYVWIVCDGVDRGSEVLLAHAYYDFIVSKMLQTLQWVL